MADNLHPDPPDNRVPEGTAGAVVGYLIAGIGGWGFLGWVAERWLGLPSGIGIVTGMMMGAAGALYLIMKRLGA
jgi:hypothetical protein